MTVFLSHRSETKRTQERALVARVERTYINFETAFKHHKGYKKYGGTCEVSKKYGHGENTFINAFLIGSTFRNFPAISVSKHVHPSRVGAAYTVHNPSAENERSALNHARKVVTGQTQLSIDHDGQWRCISPVQSYLSSTIQALGSYPLLRAMVVAQNEKSSQSVNYNGL